MQACTKLASMFSVVFVTVPSKEVGKSIARDVVESRLAACVNIVPQMISIYNWDDKLQEDDEAMLIIKTKTDQLEELKNAIVKKHPYDVPEFIALPIENGHSPYIKWIESMVGPSKVNNT